MIDGICTSIRLKRVKPDNAIVGDPWDYFISDYNRGIDLTALRRRVSAKDAKDSACTKNYYSPKTTSGGLLVTHCLHGYIHGFSHIGYSESLPGVADMLYNFWEEPPSKVFYDHSCGLSACARKRYPEFYSGTHFILDLFHARTHRCGYLHTLAWHLAQYEDAALRAMSTSLPESTNASIRRIGPSVAYSGQELAWALMRSFVECLNAMRHKKTMMEQEKMKGIWGHLYSTLDMEDFEHSDYQEDSGSSGFQETSDDEDSPQPGVTEEPVAQVSASFANSDDIFD